MPSSLPSSSGSSVRLLYSVVARGSVVLAEHRSGSAETTARQIPLSYSSEPRFCLTLHGTIIPPQNPAHAFCSAALGNAHILAVRILEKLDPKSDA